MIRVARMNRMVGRGGSGSSTTGENNVASRSTVPGLMGSRSRIRTTWRPPLWSVNVCGLILAGTESVRVESWNSVMATCSCFAVGLATRISASVPCNRSTASTWAPRPRANSNSSSPPKRRVIETSELSLGVLRGALCLLALVHGRVRRTEGPILRQLLDDLAHATPLLARKCLAHHRPRVVVRVRVAHELLENGWGLCLRNDRGRLLLLGLLH